MEKEYLVTVKNPDEFDGLHAELTAPGSTIEYVPNREVELLNYRPGSLRTAHYNLTDNEAAHLRQDPRVLSVELHIKHTPNIRVAPSAIQPGRFDKSVSTNNFYKNWALKSCTSPTNPFTSSATTQLNDFYPYVLDGENVDIVVVDSGIIPDHPEFAVNPDGTGGSRVKQIDWYAETGIPGSMPPNPYRDEDGHGTHCASIAAGNTQGWAKKANIYSIKCITDYNVPGVDIYDVFDLIRVWHENKPINPATGKKNPTIVNNSWSFISASSGSVSRFSHRGQTYTSSNFSISQRATYGLVNYYYQYGGNLHNVRVASIDSEIVDCINAGVIVVAAAGNYYHKIDVPGGVDYDNFYVDAYGPTFYHRGGTPGSAPGVICVGNIDATYPEQKSSSSECGPRIDVWAPGTYIMSAYTGGVSDSRSNRHYLAKLSGTSMASPQVVGNLALMLQMKPWMNQTDARKWLSSYTSKERINNPGAESYTNYRHLQGSENRFLYFPHTGGAEGISMSLSITS